MDNTSSQHRMARVATLATDETDDEAGRASREDHIHVSSKDYRVSSSGRHDNDNFIYAQ